MKARLLIAALCCILSAPFLASEFKSSTAKYSTAQYSTAQYSTAQYSTAQYSAAVAGHTTSGQFCVCPSPGCIPDRGEICGEGVTRAPAETDSSSDYGAGLLLIVVAGFAWLRLRSVLR